MLCCVVNFPPIVCDFLSKTRLLSFLQGEVVTRDGYSNMVFFPEDFPWKNKSLKEMLGPKFLKVSQPTNKKRPATHGVVSISRRVASP